MAKLSRHAEVRMQQRGIPPLIVDCLMQYGASEYDKHAGWIRYFDKKSKKTMQRVLGKPVTSRLMDLMNCYLVEADGRVVTVGRRNRRIRMC